MSLAGNPSTVAAFIVTGWLALYALIKKSAKMEVQLSSLESDISLKFLHYTSSMNIHWSFNFRWMSFYKSVQYSVHCTLV